jgi:hypothetical protein
MLRLLILIQYFPKRDKVWNLGLLMKVGFVEAMSKY